MTSTPGDSSGAKIPVLLSTSSVFPEPPAVTFDVAARLGYDGVEVMVWTDGVSQNPGALQGLANHYRMPILAVHAPCLLVTQRVWSSDPWERLRRSAVMAEQLGAPTVIVHPPFFWQREYARTFQAGLDRLATRFPDIRFAVENMYPVRMAGREFVPYAPHWDPTTEGYAHYTLDTSHCAASKADSLAMLDRMGSHVAHIHLGDGNGGGHDEHLVPGRGSQPCGEVLERLAPAGFTGAVSVEVATRKAADRAARERDLAEALAFARQHLPASSTVDA